MPTSRTTQTQCLVGDDLGVPNRLASFANHGNQKYPNLPARGPSLRANKRFCWIFCTISVSALSEVSPLVWSGMSLCLRRNCELLHHMPTSWLKDSVSLQGWRFQRCGHLGDDNWFHTAPNPDAFEAAPTNEWSWRTPVSCFDNLRWEKDTSKQIYRLDVIL